MDIRKPLRHAPLESGMSSRIPQFVSIGFDDNGYSGCYPPNETGGITWASDFFSSRKNPLKVGGIRNARTFDGTACHVSFFHASMYISGDDIIDPPAVVKRAWHNAFLKGHEVGNHAHSHPHGSGLSVEEWIKEIDLCNEWLTKPLSPTLENQNENAFGAGIPKKSIRGFRTPYLEYNDHVFTALQQRHFLYDCSIEEGLQWDQDGTNFFWPYTLDEGSPGNDEGMCGFNTTLMPVGSHPGLWELPCYVVIAPPDELCNEYGLKPGFRELLKQRDATFNCEDGKISGLDWNLFVTFGMNAQECLATLKYTFDLRLKGNRCPFLFGAHSDLYVPENPFPPNISAQERRWVIESFVDYVLTKPEVRIASFGDIVGWLKNPVGL